MKESKVNRKDTAIGETKEVQGCPTGSTNLAVIKRLRKRRERRGETFVFFAKQTPPTGQGTSDKDSINARLTFVLASQSRKLNHKGRRQEKLRWSVES
ncbi:uncharacterized protein TrAFT101_006872 [Trichoderma asperellum]|uniref:uncharacterized protein n=1 Tax=Trichoderma asperellum TaxID=101201 RepID=UPI00333270FE|nr:hypothetical protein TrAFT101_006872 [Trichoderma asperellum]